MGLVGVGGIGRIHLRNGLRLKNAELVAVADMSKQARNYAVSVGVKKVFEDYTKLIEDPHIDSVVISLPTFLHSECAIKAAEQGKHVFIEKPLARNVKEGNELVSKISKAGVKTMVGYPLRFSKLAAIRTEIANGYLGEVVVANATNVWHGPFFPVTNVAAPQPIPEWWFNPELTGGGALIDLGSHMINLLLWYFGEMPISVKSILGHRFNMPVEDHALCFLKFKNGILSTVNVGWYSQRKAITMEVFGTSENRSMTLIDNSRASRILNAAGIRQGPEASALHDELNHFVDCILHDVDPQPSAVDALKDLEVISQAYENQL
jgi:predicted dehydrogenase